MEIVVIAVGKVKKSPENELIKEYLKRIKYQMRIIEIPIRNNITGEARKDFEAKEILKNINDKDIVVIMDEHGKNINSMDFAQIINKNQENGIKRLIFIIGGAYGLGAEIKNIANSSISFGKMTLPHMLVRVLLVEQIYRGQQILNNHPYHKE